MITRPKPTKAHHLCPVATAVWLRPPLVVHATCNVLRQSKRLSHALVHAVNARGPGGKTWSYMVICVCACLCRFASSWSGCTLACGPSCFWVQGAVFLLLACLSRKELRRRLALLLERFARSYCCLRLFWLAGCFWEGVLEACTRGCFAPN